jgi:hypothetical protein
MTSELFKIKVDNRVLLLNTDRKAKDFETKLLSRCNTSRLYATNLDNTNSKFTTKIIIEDLSLENKYPKNFLDIL